MLKRYPSCYLFHSLRYINPTWYFNLSSAHSENPQEETVSQLDFRYSSKAAQVADAQYRMLVTGQLIHGYFPPSNDVVFQGHSRGDEYLFVRKYYHPLWSWYVFFRRLLAIKAPWKEIPAFVQHFHVKRERVYEDAVKYPDWNNFKSPLCELKPKVAVIIPTLNRYPWLKDVLWDLEAQDYPNFEVIVVDQSDPYQPDFYAQFGKPLQLIRQEEKALWCARNRAIKATNAEFLLLFDDDSRVDGNWISNHLKALDFFKADISSGVSISIVGAKVPANYSYFRLGDQVDTGNVMIRRDVFRAIGLFDRQFEKQRMGDGEFGCRAHVAGFLNVSNPYARRLHLKVGEGGLRQMGHWDGFRPQKWTAPRPIPSVLYYFRSYYGDQLAINALWITLVPSLVPFQQKGRLLQTLLLVLFAPLALPLVTLQVIKSWRISSAMIKEGPKIQELMA